MTKKNNGDISESRRRELVDHLKSSDAYRLAFHDYNFLTEESVRSTRLQLELDKPELVLNRQNVRTTIVVFGSARLLPPEDAKRNLEQLEDELARKPGDEALAAKVARAHQRVRQSRYYAEARKFAQMVSRAIDAGGRHDLVVCTGGGPGIMEAANRGAYDVDAPSAGLNITLPAEQEPNPFITPELCFQFHYFAIRKMHFLLRATALVAFPGGYGTMDELFEALTLTQTGKMPRIPIVLVGSDFWNRAVDFEFLLDEGVIDARDVDLFKVVDTAEAAVEVILEFYGRSAPEPQEFY
jgi:uncharacterized protein (TIGR00730 family)